MADLNEVLGAADDGLDQSIARLCDLVSIPSISTDPTFKPDGQGAGQWLVDELSAPGFEASLRDTPGEPMVVAHYTPNGTKTSRHVLFYGHYDVQPADPLDKWTSPPFEPVRRKGK